MVYKVQFKKSVGRDLGKISKAQVRTILGKIESELSKTPKSCPVLTGKFARAIASSGYAFFRLPHAAEP